MSEQRHQGSYGYRGETWFIGFQPPLSDFMVLAIADLTAKDWQLDPQITECTLYINENGTTMADAERKLLAIEGRLRLFEVKATLGKNVKAINMEDKATPFSPDPAGQPVFEEARPRRRRPSGLPAGL